MFDHGHLSRERPQSGFTLVPVLWTVTLLALIVTLFLAAIRTHVQVTANAQETAEAHALAESGITLGILDVVASASQPVRQRRFPLGKPSGCLSGSDGTVTVLVEDEGGKLDINAADIVVMQRLFTGLGYSRADASRFAETIADYRDADDLRRLNGAETDDYKRAGLLYGPANAPFAASEELGQLPGMPRELVTRLLPMVTVYSGTDTIDLAYAPPQLLAALGSGTLASVQSAAPRTPGSSGRNAFTIRARGTTSRGAIAESATLIGLTPSGARPYVIYTWTRSLSVSGLLPDGSAKLLAGAPC